MADDQDDSQKTEEPTQKRLDDAVKKGRVPTSREVTSFVILLVLAVTIISFSPYILRNSANNLKNYIQNSHLFTTNPNNMMVFTKTAIEDMLIVMSTPMLILLIAIILSSIIQHGFIISAESLIPKLERISPIQGFKRIFSMRSFVEFIKGLVKICTVGAVAFLAVYPEIPGLSQLSPLGEESILAMLMLLAQRMLIGVCCIMFILAAADFIYQKFEYIKSMRMSKHDIKEEFKQTEGSPEIKAKLREIRNKRAQNRMMSDVPKADVVITNPTHYSVALLYDKSQSEAPIVVAKGKDFIAMKIREVAKENNVPLVSNPPLARTLYKSVEIGSEIPFEHYQAVAEIIRYVYKLKGKSKPI